MGVKQRTPQADFDDIPGELPDATVPDDVNLDSVAKSAVIKLNSLQKEHLASIAIWRDILALTDYFRTFYSADTVFKVLKKLSLEKKRSFFRVKEQNKPRVGRSANGSSWVDVDILFTAQHGNLSRNCMGTVSLFHDANDTWRIWMLRTWLECFDGFGHPDVIEPVLKNGDRKASNGYTAAGNGVAANGHGPDDTEYGAIAVGGGQAGLAVGGRLKALGVPYVVIENHREVGDVWNERYESLKWHTSKEYGNLPFGHTYPDSDGKLMPTKRIGAGHKDWSEKYEINVLTGTAVKSSEWDDSRKLWTITAASPEGSLTLQAKNLVLTIGPGHGTPVYPSWATSDLVKSSGYQGTIVHAFDGYHSAQHWAGQRGIVIGTANTAHDIAEDMANAKMETTMVQRSPTFVFPGEWLIAAEDVHYHTDLHPAVADRETITYPNKILRQIINHAVHKGIRANPARFDALEQAGFKLHRFGDTYHNLYVRFGGHYVDIGCSQRIANGEIKMKTDPVKGLTQNGLLFEDGQEVGADLIVLCTGFDHDFRSDASKIVDPEIADQVDEYFGMDPEGEIRAHARPAGHPNLYYHGGDVRMARFYSQFVALQIQAHVLGQPMQPYLES